ncbi:hypothetical protein [Kitasatospora phosalacinea]|uniref:Uncharacterized protein n=1 Tax=Kitasatospora phosalacinea TaxID=2065 RepID=A0A9W6UMZ6_9ACTN|nr:hypothetical protein [Kitasatospora phosalacinea]GLW53040.1 hypothetical protein Kpho01_10510 [Kitasatospora phosalacinea]
MQNSTYDRYAQQPPTAWIGRHWLSTTRDGTGRYLRGLILDVRPGALLVQWPPSGEGEEEPVAERWTSWDRGTLARE